MLDFTPAANQTLRLAREEAVRLHHNYVGTEHLLLGLVKLGRGFAVKVLQQMGIDLGMIRFEVEKQIGIGPDIPIFGNIPRTPRAMRVLALAGKEARDRNHTYVGTEHILLGLMSEGECIAALVLKYLEIDSGQKVAIAYSILTANRQSARDEE